MPDKVEEIRDRIRERFGRIAAEPTQEKKFPVGPDSAKRLGYDLQEIDQLPSSLTESFCGVGNPLRLGEIRLGDKVLDLGCGAGLDSILAARRVGPTGKVLAVDMTDAMLEKARRNAALLDLANIEFLRGRLEDLPVASASVDVAITNGAFNLCPDKPKALAETFRVLKRGGRLLMADIMLEDHITPEEVARLGAWSD